MNGGRVVANGLMALLVLVGDVREGYSILICRFGPWHWLQRKI